MAQAKIIESKLGDGSKVYNVAIEQDGDFLMLHAVTRKDAEQFVEKLGHAFAAHTLETLEILETA